MKKIMLSLCALAALVSCAKELDSKIQLSESEAASAEGTTLVRAGFAEDVKTVLGPVSGNARPVYWQATDAIQINGVNSTSIEIRQDNPAVANFTIGGVVNYPYHAAYPAARASGYEDNTVLVNVPAVQNYVEGTYDPNAAVMLGYAAEGEVAFKNAMSFLKINITGGTNSSSIKSVRVRAFFNKEAQGNKGCEAMSGEFKAVFTEGNFTFTRDLCDNSSVTLDCGDGVAQGTDLYIAIPAQTYHQGLNLFIVSADDQCQEIVSKKAFDAEPGKIYATTLAYNGGMTYVGAGIYTPADWDAFGIQYTLLGDCNEFQNEEGTYVLQKDLTASAFQRLGGSSEGSHTLEFARTLDGQDHVITSTEQAVPFFTYITGTVKNLTIAGKRESFASTAGWGTCQLALDVRDGGLVENCVVAFDVKAKPTAKDNTYYYGMFRNIEAGATVKGCIAKSNYTIDYNGVTEKDLYVLPIANSNAGTIKDCRNEGNINFVQDPGQKAFVGCIYSNTGSLDGFFNTGNFTIKSAKGADVAGVAVYGGGSIKNCVNGVEGKSSENGVITLTATPNKDKLTYRVGGVACYADASSATNCGLFYGDKNYGDITLTKTGTNFLSGTGIGGIACFVRYGTTEDNTYSIFEGCENKGHLTIHEPDAVSINTPMFLGGIIGFVLNNDKGLSAGGGGALALTNSTTQMNGNYIVCRVSCKNTGTLELASANSSNIGASSSGARQHYIGGICGFAYGMGRTNTSGQTNAHYAVIRGQQDGVIKVGSAKAGNSCAGGIIGGGCYVKIDQGSAKVTYQATSLQTNGAAPEYRGACAAVAGFMLKHSVIGLDNGNAVNATMAENTGLLCSGGSLQDYTSLLGYAGITGSTSVDNTNKAVTHQLTVYGNPIATLNGNTITTENLYGGGGKAIDQN